MTIESKAIVTVQGVTLTLPHVESVSPVEKNLQQFQFSVWTRGRVVWLSFSGEEEARKARREFVLALADFYGDHL